MLSGEMRNAKFFAGSPLMNYHNAPPTNSRFPPAFLSPYLLYLNSFFCVAYFLFVYLNLISTCERVCCPLGCLNDYYYLRSNSSTNCNICLHCFPPQRPGHAAGATDTQHGDYDGHLRSSCLCPYPALQQQVERVLRFLERESELSDGLEVNKRRGTQSVHM